METKSCQNCKQNFSIDADDFGYYERMQVPPPTMCPECRMIRRMATINSWSLFYRNCDKCGKRTLSVYEPSKKMTVYCQPCWWADDWDGTEYAMDYDPNRSFLEQIKELSEKTPYVSQETEYLTLKNCDYSNALAYSKNCTLAIWADYCENVFHSSILNEAKDTADSLRVFHCELCYESIGPNKSYNIFYSQECADCAGVWFSRNCYSCTNCIGCVNLRGKNYYIFNEPYSKEEYFKKLAELKLDTRAGIRIMQKQAKEFWLKFPYRYYMGNSLNKNVTGEYVYGSKNCKAMWNTGGAENCSYCQLITVHPAKDCMDYSGWGNGAELIYESANIGNNVSNVKFSAYCFPDVLNVEYSLWCIAGKNNFGCVNLKRKGYCILNKEYSKEEYEKLIATIKTDMTRRGEYGEFPIEVFGKFAYNNSNASKFFPLTKEEALAKGYQWNDEVEQNVSVTLEGSKLPETIKEVQDDILQEVISCTTCSRKYKIATLELELLRRMKLPLPDQCLKCRENALFARLQPPRLYDRQCAKCSEDIETSYSPERPEIVYCEQCYQQEVM